MFVFYLCEGTCNFFQIFNIFCFYVPAVRGGIHRRRCVPSVWTCNFFSNFQHLLFLGSHCVNTSFLLCRKKTYSKRWLLTTQMVSFSCFVVFNSQCELFFFLLSDWITFLLQWFKLSEVSIRCSWSSLWFAFIIYLCLLSLS